MRQYGFWCSACPTRIHLETEVKAGARRGEPTYDFAESEWVGGVLLNGDWIAADKCPACHGQLFDVDSLAAHGALPLTGWSEQDESALHKKWRESIAVEIAKK